MSKLIRAFNLLELMLVLAILGLLCAIGIPALQQASLSMTLRLAAGEVASTLSAARVFALRHNANVAVAFKSRPDGVTWTLYRDGNGDGVRNADILRGIDTPLGGNRQLAHFGKRIRFGFPNGPAPADISNPGRPIENLNDPIRFNSSDLASFSAGGTATSGTIYLTDGQHGLTAVRVTNQSGKVVIWEYDTKIERWRRAS